MNTNAHLWCIAEFSLEWEMFVTKVVEKINLNILHSITFLRKSCCSWHNVEKYGGAREATDGNRIRHVLCACWISTATRAHAHAHTPTGRARAQTHTLFLKCNTYCFSTVRMVARTRYTVIDTLLHWRFSFCKRLAVGIRVVKSVGRRIMFVMDQNKFAGSPSISNALRRCSLLHSTSRVGVQSYTWW